MRPRTLLVILLLAGAFRPRGPAAAGSRSAALDLSGGLQIPFAQDSRDVFGTGVVLGLGLPTRISDSGWMILDTGVVMTAGRDTRFDPTFQVETTRLWLVPLTLGCRFNAATRGESRSSRLYLGFGFQSWLSWYDPPAAPAYFQPAFGLFAEWRHELDIADRATLFVRQRFSATTSQTYEQRAPEIGFSGATLELGLSRRLR